MTALEVFVEVAGWLGASLILGAYLLLSVGKTTGQSPLYQGMNVAGAAGFIINGWWHGAVPSAALNVIWMMIGGLALWRISSKRRSSTSAM
ncbi:MAG TPA: hypothetical protein VMN38_10195 [Sphingomicrobium sp.]|nr:hypothetical protein [Sphingomicrobium sp.]